MEMEDGRLYGVGFLASGVSGEKWVVDGTIKKKVGNRIGLVGSLEPQRGLEILGESLLRSLFSTNSLFSARLSGPVVLLVSSRIPAIVYDFLLKRRGKRIVRSYVIIPGVTNPRWIMPQKRSVFRSADRIVKPTRLTSRLAWIALKLLGVLGIPQVAASDQILICDEVESRAAGGMGLKALLGESFSLDKSDITVFTGAWGIYQKFTVRVSDDKGRDRGYVKIGHGPFATERVRAEERNLRFLSRCTLDRLLVPQIIDFGPLGERGDLALALSPPPAGHDKWIKDLRSLHARTMAQLFRATRDEKPTLCLKNYLADVMAYLEIGRVSPCHEVEQKKESARGLLDVLMSCAADEVIPLGFSHGDFTPWNSLASEGSLFLFDWEGARWRPPLWDLFYFIFHKVILIESVTDSRIVEKLLSKANRHWGPIFEYVEATAPSCATGIEVLLGTFLLDLFTEYAMYSDMQVRHGFDLNPSAKKFFICIDHLFAGVMEMLGDRK